jgi:hypothetical protein
MWVTENSKEEITNYVQEFGMFATPHLIFPITKRETLPLAPSPSSLNRPEAEFLDDIQTEVLRVSFLAIHLHLNSFALRFLYLRTHTTSYVYLQTHATSASEIGKSCAICKKCPCSMSKDMSEPTLIVRDFQFSSSTTCSMFVSKT